jgi:hypothetical protein
MPSLSSSPVNSSSSLAMRASAVGDQQVVEAFGAPLAQPGPDAWSLPAQEMGKRAISQATGGYHAPMAVATNGGRATNYLQRAPSPSGLADVIDVILDKGLVLDAFVRVSVIGIEVLTIDARIVIASVDTYLRFAEAVNRLDLMETELQGLPELREKAAEEVTEDAVTPDSPRTRGALKGAAAGAVAAAAVAAAKTLADRAGKNDDNDAAD